MPTGCEERMTTYHIKIELIIKAMTAMCSRSGGTDIAPGTRRGDDAQDQGLQC